MDDEDATAATTPFDLMGKAYDEAFTQRSGQIAASNWIVEHAGPRGRVLDLGCGAGWPTAQQLADQGLDVVGVDISSVMLGLAAERVPSAELHQVDMRELPEDIGRFNAVTANFSFNMISRAEISAVLHHVHGLLLRGGVLTIAMVAGDADAQHRMLFDVEVPYTAVSADELAEIVTAAGFVIESLHSQQVDVRDEWHTDQIFLRAIAGSDS